MSIKKSFITAPGLVFTLLASTLVVQTPAIAGGRKDRPAYYLTKAAHAGDSTLTACAEGFHMASLWEIADPSELVYDTTLGVSRKDFGFTHDDSGSGPPSAIGGWIRTGYAGNAQPTPGFGNCNAWTSDAPGDYGTAISLPVSWDSPLLVQPASPWFATAHQCMEEVRVWCVEDD